MKTLLLIGSLALISAAGAFAGPAITISFGSSSYCAPRPVYCAPRPVCAPVYYTRPVVVYPVGYNVYPVQTYQRRAVRPGRVHHKRYHQMQARPMRVGSTMYRR